MSRFELEREFTPETATKRCECSMRDLDDLAAALADKVVMGVIGKVVDGRTVSKVDVINDAEALELVQEAVDG